MNTLASKLGNIGYTENNAVTNKSTGSPLLDFFSMGGALRSASEDRICELFAAAFKENPLLALKSLFYFRDIRLGQGERRLFRVLLKFLGNNYPEVISKNLNLIAEFGRFDDLFALEGTPVEVDAFNYIRAQFNKDYNSLDSAKAQVSLLGKWIPSENASSGESKRLARKVRKDWLKMGAKEYRKALSALRERIRVVEREMCAGKWNEIDFQKVPSKAGLNYRKAFARHEAVRYAEFMGAVAKGEAKVNAGVLYPYDIVGKIVDPYGMQKVGDSYYAKGREMDATERAALDMYWNALPNYLENRPHNGLVVVDTSGSMRGNPINVAVALGIYMAERNKGMFENFFITFSKNPEFQKVQGVDIYEKVNNLLAAQWGQNTDLQRVFDLVLTTALDNKVPQNEMPDTVYIVSDMEFDVASPANNRPNLAAIREKYQASGYNMPELVFWNVNSRNTQSPITIADNGCKLVSGASPEILRALLDGKTLTPYDLFLSVVNKDRYSVVVV